MRVTASELRDHLYEILDHVLESRVSVEIERGGQLLRIVAVEPPSTIKRLTPRSYLRGEPEDLVNQDWSDEWKPHGS